MHHPSVGSVVMALFCNREEFLFLVFIFLYSFNRRFWIIIIYEWEKRSLLFGFVTLLCSLTRQQWIDSYWLWAVCIIHWHVNVLIIIIWWLNDVCSNTFFLYIFIRNKKRRKKQILKDDITLGLHDFNSQPRPV